MNMLLWCRLGNEVFCGGSHSGVGVKITEPVRTQLCDSDLVFIVIINVFGLHCFSLHRKLDVGEKGYTLVVFFFF